VAENYGTEEVTEATGEVQAESAAGLADNTFVTESIADASMAASETFTAAESTVAETLAETVAESVASTLVDNPPEREAVQEAAPELTETSQPETAAAVNSTTTTEAPVTATPPEVEAPRERRRAPNDPRNRQRDLG